MNKAAKSNPIRKAQRNVEVEVLAYIRRHGLTLAGLYRVSWYNALDRLSFAGMIRYDRKKGCYVARKYARPVTRA